MFSNGEHDLRGYKIQYPQGEYIIPYPGKNMLYENMICEKA